jgi:uncharacterized coiled-coil protein SlyX
MASSTRQRIATFLASNGPVEDSSGRATAKLRQAVGYEGSAAGFAQLLSAMERSGELTRRTKGKRTYWIAAARSNEMQPPRELTSPGDGRISDTEQLGSDIELFDYEKLAATLLARVVETITSGNSHEAVESDSWARRRIERLERQNAELERALARLRAEARALAEERDALKSQLEHTAGNLALLTDRMQSRPAHDVLSKRLGSDEQALLRQLRSRTSRGRGNEVG